MESRKAKFFIYKDQADEWRWRLVDTNGKTIADSAEGYKRLNGCLEAMENVKKEAPYAVLEVDED